MPVGEITPRQGVGARRGHLVSARERQLGAQKDLAAHVILATGAPPAHHRRATGAPAMGRPPATALCAGGLAESLWLCAECGESCRPHYYGCP